MITGHFFIAFTLAALLSRYIGAGKEDAVKIGFLAGGFALLPDIDIIYAWKEILALSSGFYNFTDAFWDASRATHRGLSHSLVTLLIGFSGFTLYRYKSSKTVGAALTSFMALYGFLFGGVLAAIILILFTAAGLLLSSRWNGSLEEFSLATFTGLVFHPFGDIFTGTPPDFLHPLDITLLSDKIILFPDSVLNLLAVLGIELLIGWAAIITYAKLKEREILDSMNKISGLGILFVFSAPYINSPTLSSAYQFVFSLIVISLAGTAIMERKYTRERFFLAVNFLAIFSLGALSYLVFYLI